MDKVPKAISEGVVTIMGHQMKVYQLDDGRRVIEQNDLEEFFRKMASGELTEELDQNELKKLYPGHEL